MSRVGQKVDNAGAGVVTYDAAGRFEEVKTVRRSLWRRCTDILAYFKLWEPNWTVEATNGRLKLLWHVTLGFLNRSHYVLQCLLHSRNLFPEKWILIINHPKTSITSYAKSCGV